MIAKHLIITGRVQGVGFRDWLAAEARRLGLAGWVRNVGENKVEALLAGDAESVGRCIRACARGPTLAAVKDIVDYGAEPPAGMGFIRRTSV